MSAADLEELCIARISLEAELLEPDYDPVALRTAVVDVGGEVPRRAGPARRARRSSRSDRHR